MYFYDKKEKIVVSKKQMVKKYNISLPSGRSVPDDGLISSLGLIPVKQADKPEINEFQSLNANGEVVYSDGDEYAIQQWIIEDLFVDQLDEENNIVKTKETLLAEFNAEKEAARQAEEERIAREEQEEQKRQAAIHLESMITQRNLLLFSSDKYSLPDYPHASDEVKAAWLTHRQALRDITTHEKWPNLEEADWPVAPTS